MGVAAGMFLLRPMPAIAVLDIGDRGPVLDPGGLRLRVTNAGILGNAFYNVGLSNDPSFEFPAHSGHECLNHAELWVGALDDRGLPHVSGGPLLEWRPTLDPADHVRIIHAGDLGTQRFVDDDGDGSTDEEILNGRDDDGDGEIDEDLGLIGQTEASCDFEDDLPEAVNYGYANGETHQPLGLSVHQEVYGWAQPSDRGTAAAHFVITNHGSKTLRNVYCGFLADLDSRKLTDVAGHLDDRISTQIFSKTLNNGFSTTHIGSVPVTFACLPVVRDTVPVLTDGVAGSGLPVVTVLGLGHTIDTGAMFQPYAPYARAPGTVSFRYSVFSNSRDPRDGGVPTLDLNRYDALAGNAIQAPTDGADDYQVLVSCGPFPTLGPAESVTFDVALIAAENLDSLRVAIGDAIYLHHGYEVNDVPDSIGPRTNQWDVGRSGLNGHEACLEPPQGVSFIADPNCPQKFEVAGGLAPADRRELYEAGHCVWTDADCDLCTGRNGNETTEPWLDPGTLPPPPAFRVEAGDHQVKVEWDNMPEIAIHGGLVGTPKSSFAGYRLYRLADWRNRESLLPPLENWALVRAYANSTLNGEALLSSVTDTTVDYERILYEQKHYPVGRYRDSDAAALNGFDYVYAMSTAMDMPYVDALGAPRVRRVESPIVASFEQRVVPHEAARAAAGSVWVVPNPFRANASWDRPVVPGDPLTRHIDFLGLPRAKSTIRIYTVAGDFVAQLDHDGRSGDGQAAWDLISRNGQDVESGIYVFSVDSNLGHQLGHFVVIR